MSIYEYDAKLHEKTMIEIGREEGRKEGFTIGKIHAYHECGKTPEEISKLLSIPIDEVRKFLFPNSSL